jgi:hypothetical protein
MGRPTSLVIERATSLPRPAGEVWARVVTPEGINHELGPWLRMTVPPGMPASLDTLEPPCTLGRSWVLAGGVVPVDWDDLGIDVLEPGHFRERSTMASAAHWQHERWVTADADDPDRCVVRDRLELISRALIRALPGGTRAHRAIIAAVFAHRHRRLRRWAS